MSAVAAADIGPALVLVDAYDVAEYARAPGGEGSLTVAMRAVGISDEQEARRLLPLGAQLKAARDQGLDDLAQLASGVDRAVIQLDRPAAHRYLARLPEDKLERLLRKACAPHDAIRNGPTPEMLRAVLAYMTQPPDYGTLRDCALNGAIRRATADDHARSVAAGRSGEFDYNGRLVYVDRDAAQDEDWPPKWARQRAMRR